MRIAVDCLYIVRHHIAKAGERFCGQTAHWDSPTGLTI
jgi:hypothetical protein